jgi:hypothetical protein
LAWEGATMMPLQSKFLLKIIALKIIWLVDFILGKKKKLSKNKIIKEKSSL